MCVQIRCDRGTWPTESAHQVVELIEQDGQLKADGNRSVFVSLDSAGERYR